MLITVAELEQKVLTGIRQLGYQDEEAQIIADVLLYAELRGNNQVG